MNETINKYSLYAPVVLRIGLSLVFLWFGSEQLMDPNAWTGLVPEWAGTLSGLPAGTLVLMNGGLEVIFGLMLFAGFFTRISALVLCLHLIGIMSSVGYNDIGVRDFGIFMATFSIFLGGGGMWSLDALRAPRA